MRYTLPAARAASVLGAERTNKVLRNTYMLLAITMLPTIVGAFVGAMFPLMAVMGMWSLAVFFAAVIAMQVVVFKNRNSAAGVAWLLALTFVMGYFLGPFVGYALGSYSNGFQLVGMAIGGTAVIFFTLAGYATVTKRDFSSLSTIKALGIGVVMMVVVSLFNLAFLQMPILALAVSSMFIVISSGLILFTINRVVRGGEDNYLLVTMAIYIQLFNLFQSLLHLLMVFAGNRE